MAYVRIRVRVRVRLEVACAGPAVGGPGPGQRCWRLESTTVQVTETLGQASIWVTFRLGKTVRRSIQPQADWHGALASSI